MDMVRVQIEYFNGVLACFPILMQRIRSWNRNRNLLNEI